MAEVRYIKTRMWDDGWVHTLTPEVKCVFIYLLTNIYTSLAGFYEMPIGMIALATGVDEKGVLKAMEQLKGRIEYIEGWVCIKNYAKHQNAANSPKVQALIEKDLEKVPEHIKEKAFASFNSHSHSNILHSEGMDRVSIGYPNEKKGSTKPQKSVGKKGGKTGEKVGTASSLYNDELFEKWWEIFPKKVGKGAAWTAWQKIKPSRALGEQIIGVTMMYAKTPQWLKDGGQFIPNPATFLNQRRFDDTPQVGASTSSKYHGL